MSEILQEHLEIELENGLNKVYIKDENGLIRFIVSLVHIDKSEQWEENGWLVKVQETKDDRELFELSRQFFKETEREKA